MKILRKNVVTGKLFLLQWDMKWTTPTAPVPVSSSSTHSSPRPDLTCPYCGKVTQRRQHLESHMTMHTGQRTNQCPYCPHKSSTVSNLKKHIRVHTGEKPYGCSICSERFRDSWTLKCHVNKKHKPIAKFIQ